MAGKPEKEGTAVAHKGQIGSLMRLDSPDPQQKEYARQMIVDWIEELSEARP